MYKIITCLVFCSFFASAQVTISNDVADYYLELDDKFHIQESQIKTQALIIQTQQKQIASYKLINVSYASDSSIFRFIIETKDQQLALSREETKRAKKQIRKQKVQKIGLGIGLVVVVILSLVN